MIDLSKLITAKDKLASASAAEALALSAIFAKFRSDREGYLNRISGIGFAAQATNRPDIVEHVIAVRQGLLDLTSKSDVVAAVTQTELKLAMLTQYAIILNGVPAEVKAAFKDISQ